MSTFKKKGRFALMVTVFVSVLIIGGCATAIKYSYDTKINFSEQKTYSWVRSWANSRQDPLLETNVQALADQLLLQKGYTRTSGKPDLMISTSYEFDSSSYQYGYQLRMLNLNIYKVRRDLPPSADTQKMSMQKEGTAESMELVWRGTASGCINTDAASGDLKQTVQGMLSNFPPK